MEISELLQKSLDDKVNCEFKKIAEDLFKNFCIKCGDKKFNFAEIEFYYYEKEKFEKPWNKVTYKRSDSNAGELFYHLSGVDICFESNNSKYGGILIRSIKSKNDLIVGPLNCVNTLLNACKGDKMPRIEFSNKNRDCSVRETFRYLGKKDFNLIPENKNIDRELNLAFYDGTILKEEWNKARFSYYSNRLTRFTP